MIEEMTLPTSTSAKPYNPEIKIALTPKELLVGEVLIANVENGQLVGAEMEGDVILPLRKELGRARLYVEDVEKAVVLFYADEDIPYDLIDKVMKTCAGSGFPNFRFAVQGG